MDPADLRGVRHRGVTLPIETTTIDRAAAELGLAVAVAEVYRADPAFGSPPATLWTRLAEALPTLFDPP
jgi:hypothetical protein